MSNLKKAAVFLRDEDGLSTLEYAISGGLIAAAVVVAFFALGGTADKVIEEIKATGEGQGS